MKNDSLVILSYDADNAGKRVGRAIIANDEDELHKISARIDLGHQLVNKWIADNGGERISGGGDEGTFKVSVESANHVEELRQEYFDKIGLTISIGVGKTLSKSGLSLVAAKLDGKNKTIWYGKKVKKIIERSQKKVQNGSASVDDIKITEAYLEKSETMLCKNHKNKMCDLHKAEGFAAPDKNGAQSSLHHYTIHTNHPYEDSKKGSSIKTSKPITHGEALKTAHSIMGQKNLPHVFLEHHDVGASEPGIVHKVSRKMAKTEMSKSEEGNHAPHTEPGIDDPCPYCADNEDARTDDCAYCQDLDAEENADGTAGMHDCPYCQDAAVQEQNVGGIDDCPYCQTENITEAQANPVQGGDHICNCPNCPTGKKDETDMAVKDMGAQHPDNCPECQEMYGQAVENQPGQTAGEDPNLQGHETAEQVLDLLDQEPNGKSPTPAQEAKQMDNTELPQGDQMRENTSVKDSFGQAQKNDVSDADKIAGSRQQSVPAPAQDEPDMAGVVQNGLDEHADEQQKQKVLDMVSQTLQGFKANKASLEATKEQNQPLYNSCIQMLKSMIELCKLLGLQPQMVAPPGPNGEGAPEPAQGNAPAPAADPATPPQTAAPAEGAAGVPKTPR